MYHIYICVYTMWMSSFTVHFKFKFCFSSSGLAVMYCSMEFWIFGVSATFTVALRSLLRALSLMASCSSFLKF